MQLNRIIKTVFLLEFVKSLIVAVKEIFKSKKTINLATPFAPSATATQSGVTENTAWSCMTTSPTPTNTPTWPSETRPKKCSKGCND